MTSWFTPQEANLIGGILGGCIGTIGGGVGGTLIGVLAPKGRAMGGEDGAAAAVEAVERSVNVRK